jgi:hypothetical protein
MEDLAMAGQKTRFQWLLAALAALMLPTVSATAEEDTFSIVMGPNNQLISGGGTGYNGAWYFYPNTGWWNQWFSNGPYDPQKKMVIDLSLTVKIRRPAYKGSIKIAYNWSTPQWSGSGQPPLPADVPDLTTENNYIKRYKFYEGQLSSFPSGSGTITLKNHYEILDYNPQWLSIDVQGSNFVIEDGWIKHECAPNGGSPPPPPGEQFDFGDAPDGPYPTLLAHDGARHRIGGLWLGDADNAPDAEADGQPNAAARGDDYTGSNDERGVSIPWLTAGVPASIYVDVSGGGGYVSAWIDFNRNGDWLDPGEQVYAGSLPNGHHKIAVTPPSGSVFGITFARFRISTQPGLGPTGLAPDGEVEDHQVWIFRRW